MPALLTTAEEIVPQPSPVALDAVNNVAFSAVDTDPQAPILVGTSADAIRLISSMYSVLQSLSAQANALKDVDLIVEGEVEANSSTGTEGGNASSDDEDGDADGLATQFRVPKVTRHSTQLIVPTSIVVEDAAPSTLVNISPSKLNPKAAPEDLLRSLQSFLQSAITSATATV
jgi:hypothetical protein